MEISVSSLVQVCVQLAVYALVAGIPSWLFIVLVNVLSKEKFSVVKGGSLLTKIAIAGILLCIFGLIIALLGFITAGVWCLWKEFSDAITPLNMALFSVVIVIAPLALTLLSSAIARAIGGTVDASQARNCIFLGIDFGGVLYALFMSYVLVYFTGGLAVLGLIGSATWAFF